jgi:hypothetical protein
VQLGRACHWSDTSIELARETAKRSRAALESAGARAELKAQRDQSQHILRNMIEGFMLLDSKWRVVRIKAEALALGERAEHEVLRRHHLAVWPEAAGTELDRLYRRVASSGAPGRRTGTKRAPPARYLARRDTGGDRHGQGQRRTGAGEPGQPPLVKGRLAGLERPARLRGVEWLVGRRFGQARPAACGTRLRAQPGGAERVLVAITGYGQEEDRRQTAAAGFDHHFVKPVDAEV